MPIYLLMLMPILVFLGVFAAFIPRRIRMTRQAKVLLAQMPQHELKTVYLAFVSGSYWGKGKETEAKIIEEEKTGWTFLKASEAISFKKSLTWGGGINLHFIRKA